jgi:hypothetical protein
MTIKNSGVLSPIAVIERIQGLIMERFHEAFLKVDAAMDELGPEDEDEKNLFGYNLYYTVQREMRKLDGMVPSFSPNPPKGCVGAGYAREEKRG